MLNSALKPNSVPEGKSWFSPLNILAKQKIKNAIHDNQGCFEDQILKGVAEIQHTVTVGVRDHKGGAALIFGLQDTKSSKTSKANLVHATIFQC